MTCLRLGPGHVSKGNTKQNKVDACLATTGVKLTLVAGVTEYVA